MSKGDHSEHSSGSLSCKWIVQKVDGDIVNTQDYTVAKIAGSIAAGLQYQRVAVVCTGWTPSRPTHEPDSAEVQPSPSSGALAPNALVKIQPLRITKKTTPRASKVSSELHTAMNLIKDKYLRAAASSISQSNIFKELERQIQYDCDRVQRLVDACSHEHDPTTSTRLTLLASLGQQLASKTMTAALLDQGVEAEHIILDGDGLVEFNVEINPDEYGKVAYALASRLHPFRSAVLVVSGATGCSTKGIAPDQLAAILAMGLRAKEFQTWTRYKGIYTADPKKIPSARLVPFLSPPEAVELSKQGTILLPKPILDQLMSENIPIRIRSLSNPQNHGTVIDPVLRHSNLDISIALPATPTAVTIKENILMLSIKSPRATQSSPTFLSGVCGVLSRFGVVVALINTSERHASVAIEAGLPRNILERIVDSLKDHGAVSVYHDMAILTIVGRELFSTSGMAGRVFSTLSKADVNVEIIGRVSDVSVGCVVDGVDATRALWLAHRCCFVSKSGLMRGNAGPRLY